MSKVKEMDAVIKELTNHGESLIALAEELKTMFTSEEPKKVKAKKKQVITKEDVRTAFINKSRAGYREEVKQILTNHGVNKVSDIDEADYEKVLQEVEAVGDGK